MTQANSKKKLHDLQHAQLNHRPVWKQLYQTLQIDLLGLGLRRPKHPQFFTPRASKHRQDKAPKLLADCKTVANPCFQMDANPCLKGLGSSVVCSPIITAGGGISRGHGEGGECFGPVLIMPAVCFALHFTFA